jgi:hypothetical protein
MPWSRPLWSRANRTHETEGSHKQRSLRMPCGNLLDIHRSRSGGGITLLASLRRRRSRSFCSEIGICHFVPLFAARRMWLEHANTLSPCKRKNRGRVVGGSHSSASVCAAVIPWSSFASASRRHEWIAERDGPKTAEEQRSSGKSCGTSAQHGQAGPPIPLTSRCLSETPRISRTVSRR